MTRGLKFAIILPLVVLSAVIFAVRFTGELFPWIPLASTISILILGCLLLYLNPKDSLRTGVIGAIIIGTGIRLIIFHIPDGLVGNDPDKFALLAHLTLLTADSTFDSVSFYGVFGGFHTFIAETAIITGMSTPTAMQVFPILFGITMPLFSAWFTMYFLKPVSRVHLGGGLAALLGGISTMGVSISYWPVAQTMGVFLFTVLFLLIVSWDPQHQNRLVVLSVIVGLGLLVSHKLPLVISLLLIVAVWCAGLIVQHTPKRFRQKVWFPQLSFRIVLIFTILLAIQTIFITNYFSRATILTQSLLFQADNIPIRSGGHPAAAVVPDVGLLSVFFHKSHAVAVLIISGIAWTLASRWTLKKNIITYSRVSFLLIISVVVGLVGISLGGAASSTSVQPTRFFSLIEVFLISLISIGVIIVCKWEGSRGEAAKSIAVTVVIILLLSQTFSASALPNYPGQPREYLTKDEVSGKIFAMDHLDSVSTDVSLQREVVDLNRVTSKNADEVVLGRRPLGDQFIGWNRALLNGDPESINRAILYRDTRIYTSVGDFSNYRYELQWDPNTKLGQQRSRIYHNGGTNIYTPP